MPATATPLTVDGLDAVRLTAGELEATFVPGAGMIGTSLRHRGDELLAQRRGLAAYVADGKTMGIPLLHPFANRVERERFEVAGNEVALDIGSPLIRRLDGLIIHGFVAGTSWEVDTLEADGDRARVRASLAYSERDDLAALFPFAHRVAVEAALGPEGVELTTTVEPTGDDAVPIAFGWHPYLTLPGVPRAEWVVGLPDRRRLVTTEDGIPTGERVDEPADAAPLADRAFDDGYDGLAEPAHFTLAGGGRRLEVTFLDGYPCAQVYAPPEYDLACFEPMTAPTNALVTGDGLRLAAPGEPFSARYAIAVG